MRAISEKSKLHSSQPSFVAKGVRSGLAECWLTLSACFYYEVAVQDCKTDLRRAFNHEVPDELLAGFALRIATLRL